MPDNENIATIPVYSTVTADSYFDGYLSSAGNTSEMEEGDKFLIFKNSDGQQSLKQLDYSSLNINETMESLGVVSHFNNATNSGFYTVTNMSTDIGGPTNTSNVGSNNPAVLEVRQLETNTEGVHKIIQTITGLGGNEYYTRELNVSNSQISAQGWIQGSYTPPDIPDATTATKGLMTTSQVKVVTSNPTSTTRGTLPPLSTNSSNGNPRVFIHTSEGGLGWHNFNDPTIRATADVNSQINGETITTLGHAGTIPKLPGDVWGPHGGESDTSISPLIVRGTGQWGTIPNADKNDQKNGLLAWSDKAKLDSYPTGTGTELQFLNGSKNWSTLPEVSTDNKGIIAKLPEDGIWGIPGANGTSANEGFSPYMLRGDGNWGAIPRANGGSAAHQNGLLAWSDKAKLDSYPTTNGSSSSILTGLGSWTQALPMHVEKIFFHDFTGTLSGSVNNMRLRIEDLGGVYRRLIFLKHGNQTQFGYFQIRSDSNDVSYTHLGGATAISTASNDNIQLSGSSYSSGLKTINFINHTTTTYQLVLLGPGPAPSSYNNSSGNADYICYI